MAGICTGGLFWRRRPGSLPFGKLRSWHAIWLLAQGWTASGAAWIFEQSGVAPPALGGAQQAELKAAVQELPAMAGIELANWNWKVVHQLVSERFGLSLSRSCCLNYLHRLGFVLMRPKKRLVKAHRGKRETFPIVRREDKAAFASFRTRDLN